MIFAQGWKGLLLRVNVSAKKSAIPERLPDRLFVRGVWTRL